MSAVVLFAGLFDLLMLSCTLLLPDLRESAAQPVGFGTTTADDDAGTGGVHVDAQTITGALDLDAADRGVRQLGHEEVVRICQSSM